MAEFLTTLGTSNCIEKIITEADKEITLVSPYLQISKTLFERLNDASKRGVDIKIIYGKDELRHDESEKLKSLENLHLYYFDNLHAKCYFNEYQMVITSMNMYEYSEKNNREMGVLVNSRKDKQLYSKAVAESLSIIQNSEVVFDKERDEDRDAEKEEGYCIRCKTDIYYDENRPYCHTCFKSWVQWENVHFKEPYCHRCHSQKSSTRITMIHPFCSACWKDLKPPVVY